MLAAACLKVRAPPGCLQYKLTILQAVSYTRMLRVCTARASCMCPSLAPQLPATSRAGPHAKPTVWNHTQATRMSPLAARPHHGLTWRTGAVTVCMCEVHLAAHRACARSAGGRPAGPRRLGRREPRQSSADWRETARSPVQPRSTAPQAGAPAPTCVTEAVLRFDQETGGDCPNYA